MRITLHEETNAHLASIFELLNSYIEDESTSPFSIQDYVELASFLNEAATEVEGKMRALVERHTAVASLGIASYGLIAMSLWEKQDESPLFPADWLKPTKLNANFAMSHMLAHFANTALSVKLLVESGLDAQARAQLRTLLELSWIIIAMLDDRELWVRYSSVKEESEKKFRDDHLTSAKLRNRLLMVEKRLGIEGQGLGLLKSQREELYSWYSSSVHHSFRAVVFGSAASYENEITLGVFGGVSEAGLQTADRLATQIMEFSMLFLAVLHNFHGLRPTDTNSGFWQEVGYIQTALHMLAREGET